MNNELPRPLPFTERWRNCTRCKLHETRTNVVLGVGNHHANIVVFGEGPGFTEDDEGIPFVGESGEILNEFLLDAEIDRTDLFIDNVVKCVPFVRSDGRKRVIRKPTAAELTACSSYIEEVIYTIDPIAIIAFGATAFKALTGIPETITQARKDLYTVSIPGFYKNVSYPVFPMFHPAHLLREPSKRKRSPRWFFQHDLHEAKKLVNTLDRIYQEAQQKMEELRNDRES